MFRPKKQNKKRLIEKIYTITPFLCNRNLFEGKFCHKGENFSGSQSKEKKKLLDEVEQNIVTCQWRAYHVFAETKG